MITKFNVQNFKSWKNTGSVELGQITGFFGANSSGKTSLLQFLLLAKQTAASPDRRAVLHFGDESSPVSLGSFGDIISGHDKNLPLRFSISWHSEANFYDPEQLSKRILLSRPDIDFFASVRTSDAGPLHVDEFNYHLTSRQFEASSTLTDATFGMRAVQGQYELRSDGYELRRSTGRPPRLPPPTKFYGFPDQVRAAYQNASLLSDLQLDFENLLDRIYYLGPLREYPQREYKWSGIQPADMGQRGERVIEAILASDRQGPTVTKGGGQPKVTLSEYLAWWLKKLRLIHSFRVQEVSPGTNIYRVWLTTVEGAKEVLITDVGFGVSQVLPVLALINYVPRGSTVVLEQPEIHLHPSVQAGLADAFIDSVKKRKIQIILESHSEHLLRRLQRRIAEKAISNKEVKLYFAERQSEASVLTSLEVDMFGSIRNWPRDFFGDELGEAYRFAMAQARRRQELHTQAINAS